MTLAQRLHALRSGSPQTAVGGLDVHNASEWRAHHAAAQLAAKRLVLVHDENIDPKIYARIDFYSVA